MPARNRPYLASATFYPDAQIDFASYPFNIPAVRDLPKLRFHPNVTFFVGENGSGKSTALEALAVKLGFNPEGGTLNVKFETTKSVSPLHEVVRLARDSLPMSDGYFLRAESFFNLATYMDEIGYLFEYGGGSLHQRSHGESFMTLFTNKLRGNGIYLFDEPEAALSPLRQMAALRAIHHLVLDQSQFIIATHSPILLAYPNAKIIRFDGSGITEIKYEETEHYTITREFLNNYRQRVDHLLRDDEEDISDR
jgi:predicted ATPase